MRVFPLSVVFLPPPMCPCLRGGRRNDLRAEADSVSLSARHRRVDSETLPSRARDKASSASRGPRSQSRAVRPKQRNRPFVPQVRRFLGPKSTTTMPNIRTPSDRRWTRAGSRGGWRTTRSTSSCSLPCCWRSRRRLQLSLKFTVTVVITGARHTIDFRRSYFPLQQPPSRAYVEEGNSPEDLRRGTTQPSTPSDTRGSPCPPRAPRRRGNHAGARSSTSFAPGSCRRRAAGTTGVPAGAGATGRRIGVGAAARGGSSGAVRDSQAFAERSTFAARRSTADAGRTRRARPAPSEARVRAGADRAALAAPA